jgi:hypothetical protein
VVPILENGPPSEKVDLLLIARATRPAEMPKFQPTPAPVGALFARGAVPQPPRRLQRARPGAALGRERRATGPNAGVFRRTPIGTEYNIFDSERYMLTLDNRALRDAAAAPYEFIEILVNDRTTAAAAIFNDHATASVDSAFSEYVFVHEFAHHFAALADEYYTSDVAYETGATTGRAVGAEHHGAADPATLKWRDLVTPGTPLPTPWEKAAFEAHSASIQAPAPEIRTRNAPEDEMDALFREQQAFEEKFLAAMKHAPSRRRVRGSRLRGEGPLPAPKRTASCSRATLSASAPSAGAGSRASSTSTRSRRQRSSTGTRPAKETRIATAVATRQTSAPIM